MSSIPRIKADSPAETAGSLSGRRSVGSLQRRIRTVLYSEIVFDAKPVQGGILCTNGRWRAKDGSTAGTTPF